MFEIAHGFCDMLLTTAPPPVGIIIPEKSSWPPGSTDSKRKKKRKQNNKPLGPGVEALQFYSSEHWLLALPKDLGSIPGTNKRL